MKTLLNNQECRIDNHRAGQITQDIKGLHIHKTYRKNKKYSKAIIKIPIDGEKVDWECIGENADKLKREREKALSDPKRNKEFVDVVVKEMARFNNLLESKEINESNRQIAERVLSQGFRINNLEYKTMEYRKLFGTLRSYYSFSSKDYNYSVFLSKTRFVIKGKENKKNIQY